jgi:hypothetical protein
VGLTTAHDGLGNNFVEALDEPANTHQNLASLQLTTRFNMTRRGGKNSDLLSVLEKVSRPFDSEAKSGLESCLFAASDVL